MKHILMSIRPEWVEKILNGEKIIEIRKSMPKCELPCKVYIYCTKGRTLYENIECNEYLEYYSLEHWNETDIKINGKVVAEFTLKKVDVEPYCDLSYPTPSYDGDPSMCDCGMGYWLTENDCKKTCVSYEDIIKYGNGKTIYLWHIDDLHTYAKPKELSNFQKDLDCDDYPCNKGRFCEYDYYDYCEGCEACAIDFDGEHCIYKQLKRPPQSWCYVE